MLYATLLVLVAMCLISTAVADTILVWLTLVAITIRLLLLLPQAVLKHCYLAGVELGALGIPTSESHALIAGLTGAALAIMR